MDISSYFKQTIEKNASDLHLAAGSLPALRIAGELVPLDVKKIDNDELKKEIYSLINEKTRERLKRRRELDISNKKFLSFIFNRFY